jgi:hypothetical protein
MKGFTEMPFISSDHWVATDALGRKTPEFHDAGPLKPNKLVGMFYWTWHTDNLADFSPVMNNTEILKRHPEAALDANHPEWKGIWGGVFWWDEPLFGYYRTTDPWVLRKHAEMLADAGIDIVFFDCTNGDFTWKSSYMVLLDVWSQARRDGIKTPKVAFLLAFAPTDGALTAIRELYADVYQKGLHSDLWSMWEGKPLIMAHPDERMGRDILNFFTFRPGQPDYVNGPSIKDHWGWLENFPQYGYGKKANGLYEQVTVGVAQNANDANGGHCYAFNAPGTFGRSYTKARGQDHRPDAHFYGLNFQEQWNRAFDLDPDLVWITGWNEWTAGRWDNWPPQKPYKPFAFPDQYDCERSRDIEPVKSWGRYGDVYYIQLVENVRRFKGMTPPEPASKPKTIRIGNPSDWNDVKPGFRHYRGSAPHRDHKGQGDQLHYINKTGRNDIVLAKIARDDEYVYFYVETAGNLSPGTDTKWMRLFIDIDRDKKTGWEGYDFVVNRKSPGEKAVVEKSRGGWDWSEVAKVDYAIKDNILEIKIGRNVLGIADKPIDLEFKWSDNMQEDGNIMDFYINGDAAPGGRFNFHYKEHTE